MLQPVLDEKAVIIAVMRYWCPRVEIDKEQMCCIKHTGKEYGFTLNWARVEALRKRCHVRITTFVNWEAPQTLVFWSASNIS